MRIEKNKDISTPIRSSRLRTYIPIIATALILSLNSCENKASEQIDNSKSFFSGLALSDFNEGSGLKYQKKRERRYQGKDPDWNPFNRKGNQLIQVGNGLWKKWKDANKKERQVQLQIDQKQIINLVVEGFQRMIESGHLDMIISKIDEFNQLNEKQLKGHKIPYDIVFLALAESGRNSEASSNVAGGYRQFIPSSAKTFGLEWKDRGDPEKSTEAALRHFLNNISIVHTRCTANKFQLSESDMWKYAFWMYNGSPKLVKKGFNGGGYDPNNYVSHVNNNESANYVPRILAIKNVLQDKIQSGELTFDGLTTPQLQQEVQDTILTKGDVLFDQYINNSNLSNDEKIQLLNEARGAYTQSREGGEIKEIYYQGAIKVIDKELESLSKDEEEIVNTILFIHVGLDKNKEHDVYSYVIQKSGTPDIVKNKFQQDFPEFASKTIKITDKNGKEHPKSTSFKKGDKVFLKIALEKSFTKVGINSKGYPFYRYTIQSGGSEGGVKKQFIKQFPEYIGKEHLLLVTGYGGEKDKYDPSTYLYPGTIVYVIILPQPK